MIKEASAENMLERAMRALEMFRKGSRPTENALNFLLKDYADYCQRRRKETEQLALWNGNPVLIRNHTGSQIEVKTVETSDGGRLEIHVGTDDDG